MQVVTLLVVGAGPYGVAVAAQAIERGVDTVVVGHPMGFWTDHMPEGMFLRSGTDWHLDASGVDTFEAFIEDRGLSSAHIDPVPIAVFRTDAHGTHLPLISYRHSVQEVAGYLDDTGFRIYTTVLRAPELEHETTSQGFVIANSPLS